MENIQTTIPHSDYAVYLKCKVLCDRLRSCKWITDKDMKAECEFKKSKCVVACFNIYMAGKKTRQKD